MPDESGAETAADSALRKLAAMCRKGVTPVLYPSANPPTNNQFTLMIISGGRNVEKLEVALNNLAQNDVAESAELGVNAPTLRILITPTLNPKLNTEERLGSVHLDYILIILDPTEPAALDKAEYESSLVEIIYLARKRIGFCFWQKNSNTVMDFSKAKMREFTKRFPTHFDSIREDDDDSVEYNAHILYNRVKRLASNPMM